MAPLLGAILATVALVFTAGALKLTSFFINLIVPVPIAVLTLRQGAKIGLTALATVAVIISLISSGEGLSVYILQFAVASYLLPLLLRRGINWDKSVIIAWSTIILSVLLFMTYDSVQQGGSLSTIVNDYIAREIGLLQDIYNQSSELTAEQKEQLITVLKEVGSTMSRIWPAILAVLSGILLLVQVLLLSRMVITREQVPGPQFANWKAPELLVWPTIAAGFCLFFAAEPVQTVAINLLVVIFLIYYLQGLAIVTYFFQQRGTSPWLRAVSYLLFALFNPLPFFIGGIGLFDLWVDFRKKRVKPISE